MHTSEPPASGRRVAYTPSGTRAVSHNPGLKGPERRRAMAMVIRMQGTATVADLGLMFRVSRVTVRKDLEALAVTGSIHRFHGGAVNRS